MPQGRMLSRTQSTTTKPASVSKAHGSQKPVTTPSAAAPGLTRRPTVTGNVQSRSTDHRPPTSRTRAIAEKPKTTVETKVALGQGSRPGSSASTAAPRSLAPQQQVRASSRSRAATMADAPSERTTQQSIASTASKIGGTDRKLANSSAQVHSRSKSEFAAPRTQTGRAAAKTPPATERDPAQNLKPTFSTLQQHYSPKKTMEPRKPTSEFIKPSSRPTPDDDVSTDVLALQTELLQLHVLRETSAFTKSQWETSAERALRIQFYEVATAYHSMRKNEGEVQELVNLQALQEWSSGSSKLGLAENVQLLGPVLNELRALTDSGGRYTRLVQEFEQWVAQVEEIWSHREVKQSFDVADSLGEEWKTEVSSLIRKVSLLAREMERIVEPRNGSSIAAVVSQCRSLVKGMSKELQNMRRIEIDVEKREAQFVDAGLESIAATPQGEGIDGVRTAWQDI
ncbi:hypothetical protein HDK64DRAFT_268444 [Phyllosticta capitalensis]